MFCELGYLDAVTSPLLLRLVFGVVAGHFMSQETLMSVSPSGSHIIYAVIASLVRVPALYT